MVKFMKKIIIISITIILILSSIVFAEHITPELYEKELSEGQELCNYMFERTNIEIGTSVPKLIPYSNERFNIYTTEQELIGHLIFEKGIVTSYNCEAIDNPTYNVTIKSKLTIDDIMSSDSPVKELNKKLGNKEINLIGITYSKKIKGFFTKISLNLLSIFM